MLSSKLLLFNVREHDKLSNSTSRGLMVALLARKNLNKKPSLFASAVTSGSARPISNWALHSFASDRLPLLSRRRFLECREQVLEKT